MFVSAEIRWFWRDPAPAGLTEWFHAVEPHGCAAGGGGTRTDHYLRAPGQVELGIKRRGGPRRGVEIKGLVATPAGVVVAGPFRGPLELWCKWSSPALTLGRTIAVRKQRWLRKFDTAAAKTRELPLGRDEQPTGRGKLPAQGCNVELTRITVAGVIWWSLCFESFGPVPTLDRNVSAAAAALAARRPPPLTGGRRAGYPEWLSASALSKP